MWVAEVNKVSNKYIIDFLKFIYIVQITMSFDKYVYILMPFVSSNYKISILIWIYIIYNIYNNI